jgi:benzoyl-CoA reductase/2-hydroxyglutaryl-CoA dehydratase subunit BcrC/BadD/HgdB
MRTQAALAILERLGGPTLRDITKLTDKGREAGASLYEIQAEATRAIAATQHLAERDLSFRAPAAGDEL